MIKYFFTILISLLFFNQSLAKDVSINENINLNFVCDLEKKIIKNSEYNYQTFSANDLDEKNNYSESGIITRKTGELIHEVTKNIKSENAEKYISIYLCKNYDKKV